MKTKHPTSRRPGRGAPLPALALLLATATAASAQHDALRAGLQAHLDSLVMPAAVPGMTLGVALPDGAVLRLAAGMADTVRGVPMTPDALMLEGSVGKTYFGAVALQLVAEGRLDLDAPLSEYLGDLPYFHRIPNAADVTVRQVMSQTSGIVRYELSPAFLADLRADPMRTFSPEERLSYLFDTEAPFPAGEGWEYSDTNYILVAMLVERITGSSAYDEIRRRILEPMGFRHTVPSDHPEIPGLAQGYAGTPNPFGDFDETLHDGRLALNPQFEWGGGGFAATTAELARWMKVLQEGRAFDPSLMDEYRTGTPAPLGPRASYGLGVIMMELPAGTAWGHSGYMPGYRTEAYYFPEYGFALALQVNSTAPDAYPPSPLRMVSDLAALVSRELAAEGGAGEGR